MAYGALLVRIQRRSGIELLAGIRVCKPAIFTELTQCVLHHLVVYPQQLGDVDTSPVPVHFLNNLYQILRKSI